MRFALVLGGKSMREAANGVSMLRRLVGFVDRSVFIAVRVAKKRRTGWTDASRRAGAFVVASAGYTFSRYLI
jgi:hypothetical protein